MNEFSLFLQNILLTVVTIATPIVVASLIRWGSAKIKQVRAGVAQDQLWLIDNVVRMLVQSAEQAGLVQLIENTGEAKKEWVIQRAQEILSERGLKIDVQLISDMIESKIHEGAAEANSGAILVQSKS